MKRMILVMLAASSLSLPALAQQNTPASSASQPSAASSQMQGNEMSPEKMKPAQIRELQQSLNDKGFRVGDVDGEWGPHTADALKKFQDSNKMPSSGQLNANTITALGLKSSDFGLSGTTSETTGQAPASSSNQEHNNENKGTNPAPAH